MNHSGVKDHPEERALLEFAGNPCGTIFLSCESVLMTYWVMAG